MHLLSEIGGKTIQVQNIEHNGKPYIPVFSSLTRLQKVISEEVAYLGVNALDLMEFTKGAELFLNPGSDYGKQFTLNEVQAILDGSIWEPVGTRVTEKPEQVMLGQPQQYPHELVEALSRFFKSDKAVKKAWLAHFHNPDDGLPPHTLIAVDAGADYQRISGAIGIVLEGVEIPNPPVDVVSIADQGGLRKYFTGQSPFYKKKLFGLF